MDYQALFAARRETLPESYRAQSGCHNCRHAFVRTEYDQGAEFFCTLNAPPRPQCRSVEMGEYESSRNFREDYESQFQDSIRLNQLWDEWSIPREVRHFGICDQHTPAESDPTNA